MSSDKIFSVKHNRSMLTDFVVLALDDLNDYIQNKYHDWTGDHKFLAVFCDKNHIVKGVKTISSGHNAQVYKPLSVILSIIDNIHHENMYLVHMFDAHEFMQMDEIKSISKKASLLLKSSGHKVCGHLVYIGDDAIPV